jgi:G:T-mismatch repair DNA endonuclease (very short patch repair protein)
VWSQSNQWKEASRKRAANMMQNNVETSLTKPQAIINHLLDECGIKYRNEEPFVYYSADNYLTEHNLIIEVMGNYWHGNPLKFNDLSELQIKNIHRDKAKRTFIQRYCGIEILYLWEKDILDRPDVCDSLIQLYIKTNGVLKNYHSFNYIFNDGELTLIPDLIMPYQDMSKDNINKHRKIAV